jgi:flagellar operon protein (TIGR03826 family)
MSFAGYEVKNCPSCGNIFRKTTWAVCQECKIEIENELSKCTEFIRRNRLTTMAQLSNHTGVSEARIAKYIRESKLLISDAANLYYPCDLCGGNIRQGNLCFNCRTKINADIEKMKHQEDQDREKLRKDNQASFRINDRLKR